MTNNLVEKFKKSTNLKDYTFLSIYFRLENENQDPEKKYTENSEEVLVPIYTPYTEEGEI